MLVCFIAVIALPAVLWLYALADSVRNDFDPFFAKIVWIFVLCSLPPLGTLLYFLSGRCQRTTTTPRRFFMKPFIQVVGFLRRP
jgi:hypothetical protein